VTEIVDSIRNSGAGVVYLMGAVGVICGLFGWRMVKFLGILNAAAAGLLLAYLLLDGGPLGWTIGAAVAALLVWFAWRYHRGAVAALGGGFILWTACFALSDVSVPASVKWLTALVLAMFAGVMIITFLPEAAVVLTGLQGGWLLAIVATTWFVSSSSEVVSGISAVSPGIMGYLLWPPAAAICMAIQWTDLRSSGPNRGGPISAGAI
jgi:hypothetical protein